MTMSSLHTDEFLHIHVPENWPLSSPDPVEYSVLAELCNNMLIEALFTREFLPGKLSRMELIC